MNKEEVIKLAALARIEISDSEAEELAGDLGHILTYVGQVNQVDLASEGEEVGSVFNIMREDSEPHESGMYTEDLLKAVPAREGDYVKVKKIL